MENSPKIPGVLLTKIIAISLAKIKRRRYFGLMSLRTCRVSYRDLKGVEHAIEVTADSLYEAVGQALAGC
jgi:hypothetical protein